MVGPRGMRWRAVAIASVLLGTVMPRCGGDDFTQGSNGGSDAGVDGVSSEGGSDCPGGSKLCGSDCVPFDDPAYGCSSPVCAPCPDLNGTAFCSSGCQINCDAGFQDCDGDPENGCETYTKFDPLHCGTCGKACAAGEGCLDGACVKSACTNGQVQCTSGGPCLDLGTLENCAHCGNDCSQLEHAQAACEQGKCVVKSCEAGWEDCDGKPETGCETDVKTSGNHCGACGHACRVDNADSTQCVNGTCVPNCRPNADQFFADCSTPAPPSEDDGCETNIVTKENCGGCGLTCQPNLVCGVIGVKVWPRCICTQDKQCVNFSGGTISPNTCAENLGLCNCPGNATPCSVGEVCAPGAAQVLCDCGGDKCKAGEQCCSAKCTDITADPDNCGFCGRKCPPGKTCTGGTCS
ncbi:MAG: hypothetical protein R3B13_06040 [Polyangiaceae bacterium]